MIADRPDGLAALYAQLSAAGLFAGTGYYILARDQLARFRDAVADDATGPALEAAVAVARDAGLELYGEALRTAPRGFPRDHPRVGLLRHRSLVAGKRLEPGRKRRITRDAALDHARATWAACAGMTAWLDEHVRDSKEPERRR